MIGLRQKIRDAVSRAYHLRQLDKQLKKPVRLPELLKSTLSRNEQYFHCVYLFDHVLPQEVREHRKYFVQNRRGFGEDAFHAMWWLVFQEFRPKRALEIGVYRGQTITLWKLLARHFKFECQVGCISPFASAGDSVSKYEEKIDYFEDMQRNHQHFDLPLPEACREFSTSPKAPEFVARASWDVIYIDGNHDYEVARQDWELCSRSAAPGGLIVLDDSSLNTDYRPPCFATAGHPGPSRLAAEIDSQKFLEIFSVGHNRIFQRVR